jgi:multidrug efflux pump subunit AcrA (membrane-fusion protein)
MRRLGALLVCGGAMACHGKGAAEAVPVARANAAPRFVPVREASASPLWSASGRLVAGPSDAAVVSMPLAGRVGSVRARAGDRLRRGDVLADVVMPEALKAAAEVAGAATRGRAWSHRLEQLRTLETQGLARAADRVEAETMLAEARAQEQLASATLKAASLTRSQAAHLLSGDGRWPLVAPFDGVVTEVMVLPGEVPSAGAAVARVERPGTLRIEVRWPARPPDEARWEAVLGDERHDVSLLSTSPVADPRDGGTAVWFSWPEAVRASAGAAVVVHRLAGEGEPLFAVPSGALLRRGGRTVVFVREAAGTTERPVEVVAATAAEVVVRGPKDGDEVAAEASRVAAAAQGGGE